MSNLSIIKSNLYKLFWKYPELKNKNYNYLFATYCKELGFNISPEFWEKMPAIESISRCKRKLAQNDELFRPDNYKVIEHRKNQQKEILESVRNND